MDNNAVADGTAGLECTPPMAALSPGSVAYVVQDVAGTFGNVWESLKSCSPGDSGGRLEIDQYHIAPLDIDTEVTLQDTRHQVISFDQLEQLPELNDKVQPAEQPQQQAEQRTETSAASSHGQIPATSVFEGTCGFDVTCSSQTKSTKSVSYTYDESRRKLFANMGVVCPFRVSVTRTPPPGTVVRVMAVFAQPNDAMHVVKRCVVHMVEAEKDNCGDQNAPREHLIRCVNPNTQYHEDKVTGRHSITVQYERPQAEMAYTFYHLRFMCLSSCHSGMNRRPVKLVWTLEHNGDIIGRQVIDLKLCACPGRDRKNEERAASREMNRSMGSSVLDLVTDGSGPRSLANIPSHLSAGTSLNQTRPQKRGLVSVATVIAGGAPPKIRKAEEEPEGEYTLKCSNKKIYNMLKFIRDSTTLYSQMNPSAWRRIARKMYGDKHMSVKSEPEENAGSGESQE